MSSVQSSSIGQQMPGGDMAKEEFDIKDVLDTLIGNAWLVGLVFITIFILGGAYALLASPVYQSDVLIQIEEKKGTTLGGLQQIASALDVGNSPVTGEIEIIKSREVIGAAINALHLDIDVLSNGTVPYFSGAYEKKTGGRGISLAPAKFGLDSLAWGGEKLVVEIFDIPLSQYGRSFRVEALGANRWRLIDPDGNALVDGVVGMTSGFDLEGVPGKINIKTLFARPGNSFSVKKHALTTTYKNLLTSLKAAEATRQSSVVRVIYEDDDPKEAAEIVNEIAKAYLIQNVDRRSEEAEKSLVFLDQQLPELKRAVDKSEEALNAYRLSRGTINLDKEAEALLARSTDLEKQRIEVELKQQQLLQRFQPGYPDLVAVSGQLASIRADAALLALKIKDLPDTQQEFFRLERDAKVNTDLYIALLNNAQQLRIGKAGTIGNVHVIDFAVPADLPTRPQQAIILGISAAAGLLLGIVAAFMARALRPTLRHADEIEKITGLPTYATVPDSKTQRGFFTRGGKRGDGTEKLLLAIVEPNDPAVESLRSMRMGLQFAMVGAPNKNILITGPTPGLGKTFVSVNLCAVLAASEKKVLLIETDMRRPRVGEYLGLKRDPGLSNYLSGDATLEQVLHTNVVPNLDVICAGIIPPNPGELLIRSTMNALLDQAQGAYDYVILDSPPLLPVGDSVSVGKLASAVFMVLRAENSTIPQFIDAARRLENAGVAVKGIIFNGLPARRYGYSYRYQYHYSAYGSLPRK